MAFGSDLTLSQIGGSCESRRLLLQGSKFANVIRRQTQDPQTIC